MSNVETVNPMHSLTNQLSTTAANDNKQTTYLINSMNDFVSRSEKTDKKIDTSKFVQLLKSELKSVIAYGQPINTKNLVNSLKTQLQLAVKINQQTVKTTNFVNNLTSIMNNTIRRTPIDSKLFINKLTVAINTSIHNNIINKGTLWERFNKFISKKGYDRPTHIYKAEKVINKGNNFVIVKGQIIGNSIKIGDTLYNPGMMIAIDPMREYNTEFHRILKFEKASWFGGKTRKKRGGDFKTQIKIIVDDKIIKDFAKDTEIEIIRKRILPNKSGQPYPQDVFKELYNNFKIEEQKKIVEEEKIRTLRPGIGSISESQGRQGTALESQGRQESQEIKEPGIALESESQEIQEPDIASESEIQGPIQQKSKEELTKILEDTNKMEILKMKTSGITDTLNRINAIINSLCDIEIQIDGKSEFFNGNGELNTGDCKSSVEKQTIVTATDVLPLAIVQEAEPINDIDFDQLLERTDKDREVFIKEFVDKINSAPNIRLIIIQIFKKLNEKLETLKKDPSDSSTDILAKIIKMILEKILNPEDQVDKLMQNVDNLEKRLTPGNTKEFVRNLSDYLRNTMHDTTFPDKLAVKIGGAFDRYEPIDSD